MNSIIKRTIIKKKEALFKGQLIPWQVLIQEK
jgi:hypothetical protein